jgi:hypothetical protein
MRESIGGAMMLRIFLVVIVIFVVFLCVSANFARAFRVKNGVINILEQSQFLLSDDWDAIDDYLRKVPYNLNGNNSVSNNCYNTEFDSRNPEKKTILTANGVCITKSDSDTDFYYRVTTYISIEFPFFDIYMTLPISGETKIISVHG